MPHLSGKVTDRIHTSKNIPGKGEKQSLIYTLVQLQLSSSITQVYGYSHYDGIDYLGYFYNTLAFLSF